MWLLIITLENTRHRVSLPFPIGVLWLILLPVLLLAALAGLIRAPRSAWALLRLGCACLYRLGGLEARLHNRAGQGIRVRFV